MVSYLEFSSKIKNAIGDQKSWLDQSWCEALSSRVGLRLPIEGIRGGIRIGDKALLFVDFEASDK